jgi:hypothetical protein
MSRAGLLEDELWALLTLAPDANDGDVAAARRAAGSGGEGAVVGGWVGAGQYELKRLLRGMSCLLLGARAYEGARRGAAQAGGDGAYSGGGGGALTDFGQETLVLLRFAKSARNRL